MQKRILHILIAIDQLLWVLITLGHGSPDETISAAAYRHEKDGTLFGKIARPLIDSLFFWQKQHCRQAYLSERLSKHLPFSYQRNKK